MNMTKITKTRLSHCFEEKIAVHHVIAIVNKKRAREEECVDEPESAQELKWRWAQPTETR